MIKCDLCGKTFDSRRAMHGHLLHAHYDEYKAVGCRQAELSTVDEQRLIRYERSMGLHSSSDRPKGFRLLNKRNRDEWTAYQEGYRYIDDDLIVYDAAEAAAEGWV